MDKGALYFISDDYYERFRYEKLMNNKEAIDGHERDRPCYYAFQDDKDERIFWMIPVSSNIGKYQSEYNKSIIKYGICDSISFGYIKGEYNAFLLQNMCPIISKYVLNKYYYKDTITPIQIPNSLKSELNAKARKILRKAEQGKKLTFTNILEIKACLLAELD